MLWLLGRPMKREAAAAAGTAMGLHELGRAKNRGEKEIKKRLFYFKTILKI
jgi:hypothetical protein